MRRDHSPSYPVGRCFVLLAVATSLAPIGLASPASAAVYTVGSDPACTHSSIPFALLTAALTTADDEIRLARNITYLDQFVHLTDWEPGVTGALTLAGGYDSCDDPTASGWTTISGRTTESTIEVDTAGGESIVTLRRLSVTGSTIRGLKVVGNSTVTLVSSLVEGNGGGIDVEPGAKVVIDFFSMVQDNVGGFGQGGGIRCWGGTVELRGIVTRNLATSGGGMFAGNDCQVALFDGAWIVGNNATDGGGLYAEGSADVLRSTSAALIFLRVRVDDNEAAADGGGVFATGATTAVGLITDVSVDGNRAGGRGGGLYAESGGWAGIDRNSFVCERADHCSTLSRNSLTTSNHGAAAYAGPGGTVVINQTHIEANSIPGGFLVGSVVHAEGAGASARLEGTAFFDHHGPDALMQSGGGADIVAAFVTASGNDFDGAAFPARPVVIGSGSTASLYSSIYWPNSPVIVDGVFGQVDCLIVSDTTGLGVGTIISTVDPVFRSPALGDFHLNPSSPAVDYCDTSQYTPTEWDIDYESRGYDHPGNPNGVPGVVGGTYDIGYDEIRYLLFADGFESGDSSRWSTTVP